MSDKPVTVMLPDPDAEGDFRFADGSWVYAYATRGIYRARDAGKCFLRDATNGESLRFPSAESAALALAALGQGPVDQDGNVTLSDGSYIWPRPGKDGESMRWGVTTGNGRVLDDERGSTRLFDSPQAALDAINAKVAASSPSEGGDGERRNYTTLRELLDGNQAFIPSDLVRTLLYGRDGLADRVSRLSADLERVTRERDEAKAELSAVERVAEEARRHVEDLRAELDAGRKDRSPPSAQDRMADLFRAIIEDDDTAIAFCRLVHVLRELAPSAARGAKGGAP
jgi:hypothetical protein